MKGAESSDSQHLRESIETRHAELRLRLTARAPLVLKHMPHIPVQPLLPEDNIEKVAIILPSSFNTAERTHYKLDRLAAVELQIHKLFAVDSLDELHLAIQRRVLSVHEKRSASAPVGQVPHTRMERRLAAIRANVDRHANNY